MDDQLCYDPGVISGKVIPLPVPPWRKTGMSDVRESTHRTPEPKAYHIGPYRVLAEIGSGGMGIVFRVRDERTSPPLTYALKRLNDTSSKALERFREEARVLQSLNHPHIIHLIEFQPLERGSYIVTELVPGESLVQLLPEQRRGEQSPPALPTHLTFEIILQIARALEAVHAAGIAHRDLKPANVMMTTSAEQVFRSGQVSIRLVDFGIAYTDAAERPELTTVGVYNGTPLYAAPEQLEAFLRIQDMSQTVYETVARQEHANRSVRDAQRGDMFALGLMLYQLVTGQHLYDFTRCRATPRSLEFIREILGMMRNGLRRNEAEMPVAIQETGMAELVSGLLASNPEERLSAADVVRRMEALQMTQPDTFRANPAQAEYVQASVGSTWSDSVVMGREDVGSYEESMVLPPPEPPHVTATLDAPIDQSVEGAIQPPEHLKLWEGTIRRALMISLIGIGGLGLGMGALNLDVWKRSTQDPSTPGAREVVQQIASVDTGTGLSAQSSSVAPTPLPESGRSNENEGSSATSGKVREPSEGVPTSLSAKPPKTPPPDKIAAGSGEKTDKTVRPTARSASAQTQENMPDVPAQPARIPDTHTSARIPETAPQKVAVLAPPVDTASIVRYPWPISRSAIAHGERVQGGAWRLELAGTESIRVTAFADGTVRWSEPQYRGNGKTEACLQIEDAKGKNLLLCGLDPSALPAEGQSVKRGQTVAQARGGATLLMSFQQRQADGKRVPLEVGEWFEGGR